MTEKGKTAQCRKDSLSVCGHLEDDISCKALGLYLPFILEINSESVKDINVRLGYKYLKS